MEEKLAIDGGQPVRREPMWRLPSRSLISEAEKAAAMKVFEESIALGEAFGYNGKYEQQYEKDFVDFMGGGFADGVNSGTNAIYCALGALDLEVLSEVIVPPFTNEGGVMPVPLIGCVPVFADSDPRSYSICAEEIEPLITKRTKAIIVAHIGGEVVDMDPIMELARANDLYVIEDCAQAVGSRYKERMVGSIGDIGAFSTMFGKHYSTCGQGGIVYTTNEELHWKAKRFADRGKPFNLKVPGQGHNDTVGLNCNLTDLAAAVGSVQLKRFPKMLKSRIAIGQAIKEGLKKQEAVSMVYQPEGSESSYWFLTLKLDTDAIIVEKDAFCKALKAEGLRIMPSYRYNIQCESPWVKNATVFGKGGFPWTCSDYRGQRKPQYKCDNAIKVAETHFNILIHENYGQKEIDDILLAIAKVEKAYLKTDYSTLILK